MSTGPIWFRDHTNRLQRSKPLFENLFENNSETLDSKTMADHDEREVANVPPVKILHEYLELTWTSTPSCILLVGVLIGHGLFQWKVHHQSSRKSPHLYSRFPKGQ